MRYSDHAAVRCQQRGIRQELVDLIIQFGDRRWVRGAHSYTLNRKASRELRAYVGEQKYRKIERKLKTAYVVVSPEGTLVTAGIRYDRIRQN